MSNSLGADKVKVGGQSDAPTNKHGREVYLGKEAGRQAGRQAGRNRKDGLLMRDLSRFPTGWKLAGWCWLISIGVNCVRIVIAIWNWRQRSGSRSSRKERCLARAFALRCHLIAADRWANGVWPWRQLAGTWDLGPGTFDVVHLRIQRGLAEAAGARHSDNAIHKRAMERRASLLLRWPD
jgi:hypothetical protein